MVLFITSKFWHFNMRITTLYTLIQKIDLTYCQSNRKKSTHICVRILDTMME